MPDPTPRILRFVTLPEVAIPEMLFFPDVTPLLVAMSYASYDVVDALLKAGADPLSAAPASPSNARKASDKT